VCVNTAYNESNLQTYVHYAHLNDFQYKLDLKLSVEGNLDRRNWNCSTHWTEINFMFYVSGIAIIAQDEINLKRALESSDDILKLTTKW